MLVLDSTSMWLLAYSFTLRFHMLDQDLDLDRPHVDHLILSDNLGHAALSLVRGATAEAILALGLGNSFSYIMS